ncbi:uncharacterized protein LOC119085130 [Bradysia coprophila]|uniref:uncharacterized protein LOC119085130 n=1 Tax=Bradysia coprophila TaxID=38358 RepID=UPI00187DCAB1|nr:uncharacterized protein LOC119085130 [Bradysia coprophila]
MKLFVLTLLVAGSIATHVGTNQLDRAGKHMAGRFPRRAEDCIGEGCKNPTITVADTWAGICYTDPETKHPRCSDKFCYPDEIIDRSTCKPDGLLKDCKCIKNPDITFIKPTTVPPTPDPFVGCESCINSKLSISDSFAGQCIPHRSGSECKCICGDVFCKPGQQIDRTTCVVGGSLSDCKCMDVVVTSTASTPIEE